MSEKMKTATGARNIAQGKPRNPDIEILRIFAMLLIVGAHFIVNMDWKLESIPGWRSILAVAGVSIAQVGVSIFFLISGYFLVTRRSVKKQWVATWLQTVMYTVAIFIIMFVLSFAVRLPSEDMQMLRGMGLIKTLYSTVAPFLNTTYWFITAYLFMLLVAPFVNKLFQVCGERMMTGLVVGLWAVGFWPLLTMSPNYSNDLLYAVTGYMAGAWLRVYGDKLVARASGIKAFVSLLVGFIVMTVYAAVCMLNTPLRTVFGFDLSTARNGQPYCQLGLVFAIPIFAWAISSLGSGWPDWASNAVRSLAKVVFGVYLIHENPLIRPVLWHGVSRLVPLPASPWTALALSIVLVIAVFVVLMAVSWVYDTLVVRHTQKAVLGHLR